ncbi:MAG: SH3 domain protein [Gammaproteobacteria bacterium]|jgi:SH3 domain protein
MNGLRTAIGALLLVQVLIVNAQTLYVNDHLQIGLHTQSTLSSTIAELLPSGTELQLIERNGAVAKVRTAAGVEGWVDGNYISTDPPARPQLQAMESELAGAQAALADLQAKLVVMEQRPEHIATERAADQSAVLPSDALREMQLLAEENQRLKQQNAELDAVLRMEQERKSAAISTSPSAMPATAQAETMSIGMGNEIIDMTMLKHWQLILLASVLLLAFALGAWLVDWRMRRRHGGFRV